MALFARNFYDNDDVTFAPFFRFVDALDNHHNNKRACKPAVLRPSFNAKFDVVETKTTYELHGEVPGADRKDISIEFTEPQTIVVRGRVERQRTEGNPPNTAATADLIDAAAEDSTVAESVTTTEATSEKTPPASPSLSHRATVTDEETEAAKERGEFSDDSQKAVAPTTPPPSAPQKQAAAAAPKAKYWFQERSIGEFSRTFTFPVPVDEEGVTASLDNGILRVTIPKQERRTNRRVAIF